MAPVNRNRQKVSTRREYFRQYQEKRKARLWPKCENCRTIARLLPDVGCLECYARDQPLREWSPAESDVLEMYAGQYDSSHLQYKLYTVTGSARSRAGINSHLSRTLGIKPRQHLDGVTVRDLVVATGVCSRTIRGCIDRLEIKSLGKGRVILLSQDDANRVIEYYKGTGKPSYSMHEAVALFGWRLTSIYRAIEYGLPSWMEGNDRRVCKVTVDQAINHLKATGNIRVRWRWLLSQPVAS